MAEIIFVTVSDEVIWSAARRLDEAEEAKDEEEVDA